MIWAGIWDGDHTKTYRMNRYKRSTQEGYSSSSYLKIIQGYLLAIWQSGIEFTYNDTPIYTPSIVKNWFNENDIPLVGWPHTPNLNSIGNIYMIYPDLGSFDNTKRQLKRQHYNVIGEA